MSVVFVGATTTVGSRTLDVPTGVQQDDILLAFLSENELSLPAGWTILHNDSANNNFWAYKVAGPSEPSSYTWGSGSLEPNRTSYMLAYRNAEYVRTAINSGAAANLAPSLSMTDVDVGLLVVFHRGGGTGGSVPSPMTGRVNYIHEVSSIQGDVRFLGADEEVIGPDDTGTRSFGGGDNSKRAVSILLRSLNQTPNAPVLTSPVGTTIERTVVNRFAWDFSDPNAGDSQSEFSLQIRPQGDTALDVDVTVETIATFYDLSGSTLVAGDYEWRVKTRDAAGLEGPWSGWTSFTAADAPAGPTVTAPTNGSTISSEQSTVTWSASEQDAYQLRRVADDAGTADTTTVLFDTGQVNSSGARSRLVEFPTNGQFEHVQVRVLRNSLWSPWSSVRVEVSYTAPAVPTVAVDDTTTEGAVRVQASHPVPSGSEPFVTSVDIFRRPDTDDGDGIRVAAGRNPSGIFADWTVASGQGYAYRVRAFGDNGTSSFSAWSSESEPVPEPDVIDGGTPSTTGTPVLDGGGA